MQRPITDTSEENLLAVTKVHSPDLLLIIFIHGFKGTDTTFAAFPERLKHMVEEATDNVIVESIIFPAYETKGELNAAVEHFADWLATLTVEKEVASATKGGSCKAKIILCGHSMGGLVAADTLISIARSTVDSAAPLWPKIIACIAFDTPFYGLHPSIMKYRATKAAEYVKIAGQAASDFGFFKDLSSSPASRAQIASASATAPTAAASVSPGSSWAAWAAPAVYGVGGLLLGGAAVSAAYLKRGELTLGYKWAGDHLQYVGNLWDEDALQKRVERLIEIEKSMGVIFRDFYTLIPPKPPQFPDSRTFVLLPPVNSPMHAHFVFAKNTIAEDEIGAHTGMFEATTNDSYYGLGLETARIIKEAVVSSRGFVRSVLEPSTPENILFHAI